MIAPLSADSTAVPSAGSHVPITCSLPVAQKRQVNMQPTKREPRHEGRGGPPPNRAVAAAAAPVAVVSGSMCPCVGAGDGACSSPCFSSSSFGGGPAGSTSHAESAAATELLAAAAAVGGARGWTMDATAERTTRNAKAAMDPRRWAVGGGAAVDAEPPRSTGEGGDVR